jgi:hypothetical protein
MPLEEAMGRSAELLAAAAERLLHLVLAVRRPRGGGWPGPADQAASSSGSQ